ncbi:hypothetical protein SAZ11_05835 [Streptomyces sp. FXJ1.4098]|nr:hypothetical protein [Streptomyces sp. FXJ1.4098]
MPDFCPFPCRAPDHSWRTHGPNPPTPAATAAPQTSGPARHHRPRGPRRPGHHPALGGPAEASEAGRPTALRTGALRQALGIDDTTPELSWRPTTTGRDTVQRAYRIQAATSAARLEAGRPDLWDSGKVGSAAPRAGYAGDRLGPRTRVYWRVKVWAGGGAGRASGWSAPSVFETGLTSPKDWSAQWIGHPDWQLSGRRVTPVVVDLPKTTARYVRLDVTRLGLPLAEGDFPALTRRLQLAEVEVRDSADPEGPDLAKGAAVTASESNTVRKTWEPALAVDGLTNSGAQTAAGYASKPHPDADVSATPITLTLDLKQTARFDRVLLYPRADVLTADGRVPGFPSTTPSPPRTRPPARSPRPPASAGRRRRSRISRPDSRCSPRTSPS